MSILNKIFGDANEKYLKKLQPLIDKINSLEPTLESFSNEKLKEKTREFKERFRKGEILNDILPEAFALVREAAKRTLGQRHFDCQLIGGIVLDQGRIAEMKTGEGKTLAATLPLYLNALEGKGCHLITVNDYLARRDTVWMGQIYHLLGLSTGCLNHDQSFLYDPDYKKPGEEKDKTRDELGSFRVVEDFLRPVSRKEAYLADITYGTNNEFGFDYLRDNMVYDLANQPQRGFNYAIVDEVDSILIDEARTPLIISAPDIESSKWYQEFARIIPKLNSKTDYEIDEKMKAATLTEEGINKIEKILGMGNIYEERGIKYLHHLEQALRAEALFKRDKDYVVKDGQILIVDEFTGRLMPGRRWSGGLHQAIEAKEGVKVQPESLTLASITFQNYFRMYQKLAGMTGTAATSAEEFDKVYGLEVITVPTNEPMIRKDLADRVYKTEKGKFEALVREIKERQLKGQPVLVGTTSIEKNEYLGKLLDKEGVPHQILNAKHHQREGEIIAQAGKLGAVTVATNMAGRGVDIILGGNPPDEKGAKEVVELGGLQVIGTERHEARRIDNQLRGRSGRQGDSGCSQFFVSLEDDLLRIFGSERIKSLMNVLKIPEDQPIEANLVSEAIESAQSKIEGMNFDLRKHILEYDDVMNKHREVIYKKRREILEKTQNANLKPQILEMIKKAGFTEEDYQKKEKEVGEENMRQIEKIISLRTLDMLWMEHLESMEHLRDSVRLRAYGQRDPLVEYKNEGHKMFRQLLSMMESSIAQTIFKVSLVPKTAEVPVVSSSVPHYESGARGKNKPGRNDPCPCGKINPKTGKPMKYKKCCWPKYG
ncbi:MAG: preprotein translocase subunit SecA [Candidatus Nealsonbacteria bacterium]|nr:MAG: preprotein translocase subunit SecA [Candidatus Nealsonbacteria bacterium]